MMFSEGERVRLWVGLGNQPGTGAWHAVWLLARLLPRAPQRAPQPEPAAAPARATRRVRAGTQVRREEIRP